MPHKSNTKEQKSQLTEHINIHNHLLAQYQPNWLKMERNKRLLMGDHWTEAEKKDHRKDFRVAYSIPLVATKYNRILGEQRANRKDWKAFGRGREDELDAEVITGIFKYIDDSNHFKDTESEIYQDGGKAYGVLRVDADKSQNPDGEIVLERIPPNEVMWDTNSKKYDLSDAQFFQRFGWFTRTAAKSLYGFDVNNVPVNYSNDNRALKSPENYYSAQRGLQLIKIVWHYERFLKRSFLAKNFRTGDSQEFDKKEEAESYIREQLSAYVTELQISRQQMAQYRLQQLPQPVQQVHQIHQISQIENPGQQIQQPVPPEQLTAGDFRIVPKELGKVKCTVWSAVDLLDEYEIDSNLFPYVVYFPLFDGGDYWSLLDLVHDPQRWFDRFASMIDKATVKNIKGNNMELVVPNLDPSLRNTIGDEIKKLNQGGHVLKVSREGALKSIPVMDTTLQMQVELLSQMMNIIEDLLGGRAFQGLADNSNQTARGIMELKQSAQVGAYIFLDNLRRWKQLVGEKILELIPGVYNRVRQVRIEGKVFSQQVLQAMQESGMYEPSEYNAGTGFLKVGRDTVNANVDITLGEVDMTQDIKQQKLAVLMAVNQQYVETGMPPIPPEIWLPYTELDPTESQMLIDWFKQQQNAKSRQQSEQEQAIQQEQSRKSGLDKAKLDSENAKTHVQAAKAGVDNIVKLHKLIHKEK